MNISHHSFHIQVRRVGLQMSPYLGHHYVGLQEFGNEGWLEKIAFNIGN